MCLISWERTKKGDPHKLFRGDVGVKKGVPDGPFSAQKFSLLFFFPSLTQGRVIFVISGFVASVSEIAPRVSTLIVNFSVKNVVRKF